MVRLATDAVLSFVEVRRGAESEKRWNLNVSIPGRLYDMLGICHEIEGIDPAALFQHHFPVFFFAININISSFSRGLLWLKQPAW